MKYDDASWHFEGDYSADLPKENAATHIGMFFKWCICQNLYSEDLAEDDEGEINKVQSGEMTGAEFLLIWDGKLVDDMLSEEGNLFAEDYYASDNYIDDYCEVFNQHADENGFEYASLYHVEDTAENYDLMAKRIDERFLQWKQSR